jgi:hypothetical protein
MQPERALDAGFMMDEQNKSIDESDFLQLIKPTRFAAMAGAHFGA